MSARKVQLENIGPVEKLSFTLPGPGVTVLSASNGSGKSIVLDAMQKLAKGGGKVPLRDGARRGRIEGFGAVLTIGAKSTHTGEFEVSSLEGRFDLAELVDPKIADPIAADRRRIRALVSLTGVKPDISLFSENEAFPDFAATVSGLAAAKHDLVDMAEEIKRNYEAAARKSEDDATKELAAAKALDEAIGEVDLHAETDETVLAERYNEAVLKKALLQQRQTAAQAAAVAKQEAQQRLEAAKAEYKGPTVDDAAAEASERVLLVAICHRQVEDYKQLLADAEQFLKDATHALSLAEQRQAAAENHERLVAECEAAINSPLADGPTDEDLTQIEQAIIRYKAAMDYGVTVRHWKLKASMAAGHREKEAVAAERGRKYRQAAGSIDEVLSSAIQCDALKIASVDDKARLVAQHPVRGETPYHELSEGERWRIAMDLAADQVGEGGLIVIPQTAWEGIDVFVRPELDQRAKERKVYVLTSEATRVAADGKGFQAKPFEAAEVASA